jgi:hypothetical protein
VPNAFISATLAEEIYMKLILPSHTGRCSMRNISMNKSEIPSFILNNGILIFP